MCSAKNLTAGTAPRSTSARNALRTGRAALGSWMTIRSLSCAFSPLMLKLAEPVRKIAPSISYAFKCIKALPRLILTLSARSPRRTKSCRSRGSSTILTGDAPAPGGVERVDHDPIGQGVAGEVDRGLRRRDQIRVDAVEALLGGVVDFVRPSRRRQLDTAPTRGMAAAVSVARLGRPIYPYSPARSQITFLFAGFNLREIVR